MSRHVRFALLTFVGLIFMQAAWILAVPPFRGIDEFDHVYRAAGAAEGQWRLTEEAAAGRGRIVAVPEEIVDAASTQCADLDYTGVDNCFPISNLVDGTVTIATAAGQYHPLYYFALGRMTREFEGAGADYAMRIVSSLVCAAGCALAALALSSAGAGPWTRFGFLASLTPVLLYTTTLPAPNGPEIVAGLCLWTSLMALLRRGVGSRWFLPLLLLATASGCTLGILRILGPMLLGLIVLSIVAFVGVKHVWSVTNARTVPFAVSALMVTAAVAHGAWWTLTSGLTEEWVDVPDAGDAQVSLGAQPVVWVLQVVGAFPLRNDPAPVGVYALYLLVVAPLLMMGLKRASGRERWVLAALMLLVVTGPVVLTYATADTTGVIWQGRYGLAFAVGVLMLCGSVLDRTNFASREVGRLMLLGWAMVTTAHAWSIIHVLQESQRHPVSAHDSSWMSVPTWALGLMVGAGALALWAAVRPSPSGRVAEPGSVPLGLATPTVRQVVKSERITPGDA